uniref:Transmembrane and coiled-coil domain family 1b n=3 Tax=Scophthalmus maximus TaxID=52904 RepID=A0A8D3BHF3_SCOMX
SKLVAASSLMCLKFDSTDNISVLNDLEETQGDEGVGPGGTKGLGTGQWSSPMYGSDVEWPSTMSGSPGAYSTPGVPGCPPSSKSNSLDRAHASGFDAVVNEIEELQENQGRLEESFENLKAHYQWDYTMIMEALQEEEHRCERLEEQLNDLTDLHQSEIPTMKQELARMDEKITYHSHEIARDIQEALEACQLRISKMARQQQVVQLEGLENATAGTLLGKLINVLLAFMAVLLEFVSTVAEFVGPFTNTRIRTHSTLLFAIVLAFLWRHWDAISEYLHRFFLHPR